MLNFTKNEGPKPRCLVTHTTLSNYIDHDQPPHKKRPFNTILSRTYSHTLDLLLPEPAATSFTESFLNNNNHNSSTLIYSKVHMKLLEILTGNFFHVYLKSPTSNILMLSEGRRGIDPIFSICEGILRLEVDKPTYERLGLSAGGVIRSITSTHGEGKKHEKSRFAIEIDLRSPKMVQGTKGWERVVWACKNVLNWSLTWLFVDFTVRGKKEMEPNGSKGDDAPTTSPTATMKEEGENPLQPFAPTLFTISPEIHKMSNVLVPIWPTPNRKVNNNNKKSSTTTPTPTPDPIQSTELLEWISLAILGSPRITANDVMDSYLCRYSVPSSSFVGERSPGSEGVVEEEEQQQQENFPSQQISKFRWRGLVHPGFVMRVVLAALKASGGNSSSGGGGTDGEDHHQWMAMSAAGFDGEGYTVLIHDGECVTWEYQD